MKKGQVTPPFLHTSRHEVKKFLTQSNKSNVALEAFISPGPRLDALRRLENPSPNVPTGSYKATPNYSSASSSSKRKWEVCSPDASATSTKKQQCLEEENEFLRNCRKELLEQSKLPGSETKKGYLCSECRKLRIHKSTHPMKYGFRYCPITYPDLEHFRTEIVPQKQAAKEKAKSFNVLTHCSHCKQKYDAEHRQPDQRVKIWYCPKRPFKGSLLSYDEWYKKSGKGLVQINLKKMQSDESNIDDSSSKS